MPIVCVDLIIAIDSGFLVVKRKNHPAKNQWWLPGGRVNRNESVHEAAVRKARQELGLEARVLRQAGVYDLRFPRGPLGIKNLHNIDFVLVLEPAAKWLGKLVSVGDYDKDYSDWKISRVIEHGWHPYLITILKDAGFKMTERN